MNTAILVLLFLCSTSDADGGQTDIDVFAGNACIECHSAQEGRLPEIVHNWNESVHHENGVACQDCHGGDETLTREQFVSDDEFAKAAHATFNAEFRFLRDRAGPEITRRSTTTASFACKECHVWSTERRLESPHGEAGVPSCLFQRLGGVAMSRERGIAYICAKCHSETVEKQFGSQHGRRGAPSCLFCHGRGSHAIKRATIEIIDPRPREEQGRCSLCHQPQTMNAVAHVRKTLEESDELMRTAAEQFAKLQGMGYRSLGLAEMNAHLEVTRADLRRVQHGCNLREIAEVAKSIESVAKRTAYDFELVHALHDARQRQAKLAMGVADLLLLLAAMLLVYKRAFCPRPGPWPTRNPSRTNLTPPCNDVCPAGNNIQGFIAAAAKNDYDRALEILLETTPLPGVCGRVCPAPCMTACNRGLHDESTNIRELERYVADRGRWRGVMRPSRDEKVAVVGSGPAGLSAAYHLARLGYRVTLIERDDELGGVLRTGIPAYRLPHDVLDREIARILQYDVTPQTGQHITREGLLNLSNQYAAVFVATGLQRTRYIDLGGDASDTVHQGIDFLGRARTGEIGLKGQDVVVIGGGNVAIDVARTAVRLSAATVRLFCLESRGEMPAHVEEIEEAEEEGIEINTCWGPAAILGDKLRATGVEFKRCVAVFDRQRRFAPTFDESEHITVDADTVILALGQAPDRSILPEGIQAQEGLATLSLTAGPIFTGGDFAASKGTVTAAIGSGHRAALHIHQSLTGENLFPAAPTPVATPGNVKMHLFSHAPRRSGAVLSPEVRRTGFAEAYGGLSDNGDLDAALAEAQRCFSCGVCNLCDRCVTYCPEGITVREGDGLHVEMDYCKGCGVCAAECPRGVIRMIDLIE